jgi:hypothetical protein
MAHLRKVTVSTARLSIERIKFAKLLQMTGAILQLMSTRNTDYFIVKIVLLSFVLYLRFLKMLVMYS